MKTIKMTLLAVSLTAMTIPFSAFKEKATTLTKKTESKVTWNHETMDVGEILQGTPHTVKFEFKNTSDQPVLVNDVKAQCGCTATEYSKSPVAPGKSGYVTATYNAAKEGSFAKTVTVTTTGGASPQLLTIRGTVIAKK